MTHRCVRAIPSVAGALRSVGPVLSPNVPGGEPFRAVVADAWPMLRLGVARVVDDAGGRVVAEAADGPATLTAVRTHRPELLVIGDGVGGDVAGLVALARKATQLVPKVRCVALVSGMSPDELREVLTAGMSGLLLRSADPDELRSALLRVVSGQPVVSPQVVAALFGSGGGGSAGQGTAAEGALGQGVVALTSKEREVLALLSSGKSNAEIASALFVSAATVKTHLAHIYAKLGVGSRYEALALAVALGMVS
jgi:DNA-binding NarL/FixJ family response regulator